MPKVYLSLDDREKHRFCDWVAGEMRRRGITQESLGKELGRTQAGISKRLKGSIDWTLTEIICVCRILGEYTFEGGQRCGR